MFTAIRSNGTKYYWQGERERKCQNGDVCDITCGGDNITQDIQRASKIYKEVDRLCRAKVAPEKAQEQALKKFCPNHPLNKVSSNAGLVTFVQKLLNSTNSILQDSGDLTSVGQT